MFHSQEVTDYINGKLKEAWPPEQTACSHCELKRPSWRTLYRWIYEKYLVNSNLKVLRRKGKSHGVKEARGKYSKGKPTRKRDKPVYSRQGAGHWDADTVVSGRGKTKPALPLWRNAKHGFTSLLRYRTEKPGQWKMLLLLCCPSFLFNWSKSLLVTGVRSSPTGFRLKNSSIVKSILPARIASGRKAQLKI